MEEKVVVLKGIIKNVLPKGEFKVELVNNEHVVHCRPSGKMRTNYIKMIAGDKVMVRVSVYDINKGVIVYRGWK